MSAQDLVRYGLRYAFTYVGVLAALFVGGMVVGMFYQFRLPDLSTAALIAAAMFTYNRFLRDKVRLPTSREYWALVAISTAIVLLVDSTLAALVVHYTRDYGLNGLVILILVGMPILKGVLGNMILYAGFFGKRALKEIKAKRSRADLAVPETVD